MKCRCIDPAPVAASPAQSLRLQRRAADRTEAEPATAPPIVNEVLGSPGEPLDAATRAFMEPRFGHDFGKVRVHADADAAESARAVNARAYTVGRNIVFGAGQYEPGTTAWRRLLAHELAHAIQQGKDFRGSTTLGIGPHGAAHERLADAAADAATAGQRVPDGALRAAPVHVQRQPMSQADILRRLEEIDEEMQTTTHTPEYEATLAEERARLLADLAAPPPAETTAPAPVEQSAPPSLKDYLAEIRTQGKEMIGTGKSLDPDRVVDRLFRILAGLDLTKPKNMRSVTRTISEVFASNPDVLFEFLAQVEATTPPIPLPAPSGKSTDPLANFPGRIKGRGAYGMVGPGVAVPVLAEYGRPLYEVFAALGYGIESGGAFLSALYEGLSTQFDDQALAALEERLVGNPLYPIVFPPVFLAGTAAGVLEGIADFLRWLSDVASKTYDLLANPDEMITAAAEVVGIAKEVVGAFFSPDGATLARDMGLEVGSSYAQEINKLLAEAAVEFAYDLGRLIGPTVIGAILSLLGVPAYAAAATGKRLAKVLIRFEKLFPSLGKLLERWRIDPDSPDRSDEPAPRRATGLRLPKPKLRKFVSSGEQHTIALVETDAGPKAFYLRTGRGGNEGVYPEPGDWAPFHGSAKTVGPITFVDLAAALGWTTDQALGDPVKLKKISELAERQNKLGEWMIKPREDRAGPPQEWISNVTLSRWLEEELGSTPAATQQINDTKGLNDWLRDGGFSVGGGYKPGDNAPGSIILDIP